MNILNRIYLSIKQPENPEDIELSFELSDKINGIRIIIAYNNNFHCFSFSVGPLNPRRQFIDKRGISISYLNPILTATNDPVMAEKIFEKARLLARDGKKAEEIYEIIYNGIEEGEDGKLTYNF